MIAEVDHRLETLVETSQREFAVDLPDTSATGGRALGEQKEFVKRSTGESLGKVTVSVGVATIREREDAASLVERADGCLYAAERAGRNRVVQDNQQPQHNAATIEPPASYRRER